MGSLKSEIWGLFDIFLKRNSQWKVLNYIMIDMYHHDHRKALSWFLKAVENGDTNSMEFLGEIYARGSGVERNFTKELEWTLGILVKMGIRFLLERPNCQSSAIVLKSY